MAKGISSEISGRLVKMVSDYFDASRNRMDTRKQQLTRVYKEWKTFHEKKQTNWSTSFKINKMHEIIEKILPKIMAKNPRWLVTPTEISNFPDTPEILEIRKEIKELAKDRELTGISNEQMDLITAQMREEEFAINAQKAEMAVEWAQATQDYLTFVWETYKLKKPARRLAKSMIAFGKGYAKVVYKWERAFVSIKKDGKDEINEEVVGEHPDIDVRSWTDIWYDARFVNPDDRPGWIDVVNNIRLSRLFKTPDKYFNLDKVEQLASVQAQKGEMQEEQYRHAVQAIAGITDAQSVEIIDTGALRIVNYYGWFSETGKVKDEKLYKASIVGGVIPIQLEQISSNPYVEAVCFEDTETGEATGFIEPIMDLQREQNYKKNSASEFINKALTRQVMWSRQSGIDPRKINDPVIVTTKSVAEAEANFKELNRPDIDPSYFQEQNDFERQIQGLTFTVDTAQPQSQQGLTNTATGIRIKFFETNSVVNEVRTHWEDALVELAQKMLQAAFENMEDNIVFKKMGTKEYWQMNREMIRNALLKYDIQIEYNSSSFDDIESRRTDAIAHWNIAQSAKQNGVPVNLPLIYEDILNTFEKREPSRYLSSPIIENAMQSMAGGNVPQGEETPTEAAALTKQVAGGGNLVL